MWPTSSSNPNQWSFNPAVYQNVPYEQVDWATLAQQWIKMKETLPSVSPGPPPPPAPQISKLSEIQTSRTTPAAPEIRPTNDIEGGEAPMDMDTKEDDIVPALGVAADSNWKQWNDWQSQWGWGWPGNAGTVPVGEKTRSSASTVDSKVKSLSNDCPVLNDYVSNIGTFPSKSGTSSTPQVPSSFNYNKVAGGTIPPTHPKSGYWTENAYTTGHGKSSNNKSGNKHSHQKQAVESYPIVMDAAKKKQLPAWLREGLNKMEREKQKKMEYERMLQEKLMRDQMSPEKLFKTDIFADSIDSPNVSPPITEETEASSPERYEKSRSASVEPAPPSRYQRSAGAIEDANIIRKTKDQIMEESMLKVRRILTEFLLEATENQVTIIAKEELRKRKSASAPQIRKSNALTSLTGNLGLAVYDSDSESSTSEREKDDREIDSDEELQMLIAKKQRDFVLVEDKIEEEIENQEYKERQVAQRDQELENDEDPRSLKLRETENDNNHRSPDDSINRSHRETFDRNEHDDKRTSKSSSVPYNKVNSDKQENLSKNSKTHKRKKRVHSSSTSSSSSSSSSRESSPSTESSSSSSDRSSSKNDSSSSGSRHSNNKKKNRRSSQKKGDMVKKESKRSKNRSKSRSMSRSRYSRDEKRRKDSKKLREESSEHQRSRDSRRMSDCHQARSSTYRKESKDGRDSSMSKYKDSRKHDFSNSKRKHRRNSSRESRHRYKRR